MVYSGAAITLGNELKSNASGKVVTLGSSGKVVGYILDIEKGIDLNPQWFYFKLF